MAVPDTATVVAKWKQRSAAAAQDYAHGVANTDKDPTALAIQAGPRYIQRITESFNSGKWANGLRRTGKSGWQAAVAAKGVTNYSTGVQNADAKMSAAFGPLLAYISQTQQTIGAMPNVTDADRDARMLRNAQLMRAYKKPS